MRCGYFVTALSGLSTVSAQLNDLALAAGLEYFGAAGMGCLNMLHDAVDLY